MASRKIRALHAILLRSSSLIEMPFAVESSVGTLRNKIFAVRLKFSSLEEANAYMARRLEEINKENRPEEGAHPEPRPESSGVDTTGNTDNVVAGVIVDDAINNAADITPTFTMNKGNCTITEEKKHLLPYRPPLELAVISENTVDSYSMITVDTCKYSVPEYFVGKSVTVKKYHDEIRVFANGSHANSGIGT